MFGNFIYFIIALLIYATYQPAGQTNFSGVTTLVLFVFLFFLFAGLTRRQFNRIIARTATEPFWRLDRSHQRVQRRQTIMALAFFAIDIYGLNITNFLSAIPILKAIPTLEALICIAIFIAYMAVVWGATHDVNTRLYPIRTERKTYVLSQIAFNVPVFLPWLMLSGIADLIQQLPFDWLKSAMATTEGQVVYFLIFLFVAAIVAPAIVKVFWGCQPMPPGPDRRRIEALLSHAGMRFADILHWPIFGGRMITAGVMGLVAKFRYLLVTDALLSHLSSEEVDAVIAHEIGHVKKKHLLFYLFFLAGYMLIAYAVFDVLLFSIIYAPPVTAAIEFLGLDQVTAVSLLFGLVTILIFLVYFRYIFGFFMRNFERQADAFVYSLFNSAQPLISTLQKIAASTGQPPDRPNWHHFSISERIDFLRKCEVDRSHVRRHNGKIKKSMAIYLTALAMVGVFGYQLNFGAAGKQLNARLFEKILLAEIEKHPHQADLYAALGDLYFTAGNYPGVIQAYRKSLALNPESPEVLNNLAWLYATCEDKSLRDPEQALDLAQQAIARKKSPHILDTLAESLFINGYLQEAIEAELEALALAKTKKQHFRDQLERFSKALGKQSGKSI